MRKQGREIKLSGVGGLAEGDESMKKERGAALKEILINWSIFTFPCAVDSIRRKH